MAHSLNRLTPKQKLRIQTRHKNSIARHGYQPQALFWSNREIQETRFQQLLRILPAQDSLPPIWSLLDVGCGFADLASYLNQAGYQPEYHGVDVSQDVLNAAKNLHPTLSLEQGELGDFGFADNGFDYVMLSGALNEVVETEIENLAQHQGAYAQWVIMEMYRIAKRAVAFNLLDARHSWVQSRSDLQSFNPDEIVRFCQRFADQVMLIDGYLENDFTIHLIKESLSSQTAF